MDRITELERENKELRDRLAKLAFAQSPATPDRDLMERLQILSDISSDGFWDWDLSRDVVVWSPRLKQMLEMDDRVEEPGFDFIGSTIHPADRDRLAKLIREHMSLGLPFDGEFRAILSEGQIRVFSVRAQALRHADGTPYRIVGSASDITDRVQARDAIEASEMRYRMLAEATQDVVTLLDGDARITYASPSTERITGHSPESLIGKSARSLVYGPDRLQVFRHVCRPLERSGTLDVEWRLVCKSGDLLWMQTRFSVLLKQDGSIEQILCNSRDVSARKLAESRLDAALQKLNFHMENSPLGVIEWDSSYLVQRWSKGAERIFGWTAEEALGKGLWELPIVYYEDREVVEDLQRRRKRGVDDRNQTSNRNTRKDGSVIYCEWYNSASRNDRGELVSLLSLVQDVTERKRSEEQLFQSQKMESIGRLAGGVAHDFNNMLTAILGYSVMLERQFNLPPDALRYLHQIRHAGERSANLTAQLLAFARHQVVSPKVEDLNLLVDELDQLLRPIIGEHITLAVYRAPNLGRVRIDSGQFTQVMLNLTINARDAMPDGGYLTVSTSALSLRATDRRLLPDMVAGDYVCVSVSDSGIGIAPEVIDRVFEPFFTTKEIGKGTGLGLASCYGIVRQNKGNIQVESAPGQGATFRLYLPVERPLRDETPMPPISRPGLQGNEYVLVVEDDDQVREITVAAFASCGYQVTSTANASKALKKLLEPGGCPQLLVTDVVMPELSGPVLAERATSLCPDLRVLYVSGYPQEELTTDILTDSKSRYLQKPFTSEALLAAARELLDSAKPDNTGD